ncbi:potassium channel family protein [Shewanella sp. 0m-8]
MKLNYKNILLIYIAVIAVFAFLYWSIPDTLSLESPKFSDSLYFSVVTITTLGYGEITPISDIGKLLISIEAIFGVIVIGLFLNAFWQSFSEKIEASQKKVISEEARRKNIHEVQGSYEYLTVVIDDYNLSLLEMTTTIMGRDYAAEPHHDFPFSGMKDIFKQSLLLKNGFSKSAIELFFGKQDLLFDELKTFLLNHDLHSFPELRGAIIEFLKLTRQLDVRDGLYSIKNTHTGGQPLKDLVEKLIEENETCPEGDEYKSHILTPVIMFYQTLRAKILITKKIRFEFESIATIK